MTARRYVICLAADASFGRCAASHLEVYSA